MKHKKLLIIVLTLMFLILSGCINNENETTRYIQPNATASEEPLSTNVENDLFCIQDDDVNLNTIPLSKENMYELIDNIETYWSFSSTYFSLSTANDIYGVGDLRKTDVDGETVYYCLYRNDELKLYLFFDTINNQANTNLGDYRCFDYMCLETTSYGTKVIKGKDLVECIIPLDLE